MKRRIAGKSARRSPLPSSPGRGRGARRSSRGQRVPPLPLAPIDAGWAEAVKSDAPNAAQGSAAVPPENRFGPTALTCLTAYLEQKPEVLTAASATLLENLLELWARDNVPPVLVWQELGARLALSNYLRRRGIRARKGEGYRSTKLP